MYTYTSIYIFVILIFSWVSSRGRYTYIIGIYHWLGDQGVYMYVRALIVCGRLTYRSSLKFEMMMTSPEKSPKAPVNFACLDIVIIPTESHIWHTDTTHHIAFAHLCSIISHTLMRKTTSFIFRRFFFFIFSHFLFLISHTAHLILRRFSIPHSMNQQYSNNTFLFSPGTLVW